jgi:hypothetical protein
MSRSDMDKQDKTNARKPYEAPRLQEVGRVEDLTRAGANAGGQDAGTFSTG